MPRPAELDERMQVRGAWPGEQPVPGRRTERGHQRQLLGGVAETGRPNQSGELGQRVAHRGLAAFVDRGDQEDCSARQPPQDGLRLTP